MKKNKLSLLGRIRCIFHANRRYKSYYVFDVKPKDKTDGSTIKPPDDFNHMYGGF